MTHDPLVHGIPLICWSLESLLELPLDALDCLERQERTFVRVYLNCAVWYRHVGSGQLH